MVTLREKSLKTSVSEFSDHEVCIVLDYTVIHNITNKNVACVLSDPTGTYVPRSLVLDLPGRVQ